MFELIIRAWTGLSLLAALFLSMPNSATSQPTAFTPIGAFCDRQNMVLESIEEIDPWLDYLGGLRTGRTAPPDPETCASNTLRTIFSALTAPDLETAVALRNALIISYANKALSKDSAARARDTEGNFRYLNDLTAASLLWLTCPKIDGSRAQCFEETSQELNEEFLRTSPVFCDYTRTSGPSEPEVAPAFSTFDHLPGLCSGVTGKKASTTEWLKAFSSRFGGN